MLKHTIILITLFSIITSCSVNKKKSAWKERAKTQIMFSSNRDGNFEVYVMDDDSTNVRRLTDNKAVDYGLNWSPDGKYILFYSTRSGNEDVWRMNADGTNPINLTNAPSNERAAAYSPDGKTIVFISNRDNNKHDLYLMDADGSNIRRITNNKLYCESPEWTKDGKKIIFTVGVVVDTVTKAENGELFIVDADGRNQKRLTNREGWDSGADVSPDGKKIAFYGKSETRELDIFIMNLDGSKTENLTNDAIENYSPSWSPDGKWISFTSGSIKNYDIWKMNVKTKERIRLTTHPKKDETPYYKQN